MCVTEERVSRGWIKALFDGAKRQDKREQGDIHAQEVLPLHDKELHCVDVWALEQVVLRVVESPSLETLRTVCTVPCALRWACLSGEVELDDPVWSLSALPIL